MDADPAALAAFAAWLLAVLPRLFLYPGGLFAAAGALLLTLALRRHPPAGPAPAAAPAGPARAVGAAVALAWSALALLPLPGAAPWPGAPDLLVPLALLLGAAVLDQAAHGSPEGWRREAAGRPLLLAAPLVAAAVLGAGGLLPAAVDATLPALAQAARLLAGLAYVAGFGLCYAAPDAAPWTRPAAGLARVAGWLGWWGWLGVGVATIQGPGPGWVAAAPAWAGPLVLALVAGGAASLLATPAVRALSARAVPWGWAALGLAILAALLAR